MCTLYPTGIGSESLFRIIGGDTVDDTRVQVHPPPRPVRLSLFEQRNQITGTRRLIVNKCIEQVNFRDPVVVVPHHCQPSL